MVRLPVLSSAAFSEDDKTGVSPSLVPRTRSEPLIRMLGVGEWQTIIALSPEDLETIVARAVRRALTDTAEAGMVTQSGSPLGSRRHCNAVKRRIAAGLPGAAKVGRRYLLSQDALAEELSRTSAATAHRPENPGAKLRSELGLRG